MKRRRSPRCALRKERIDLLRDMLIEALGNMCVGEGCQTPADNLEIDHVEGCTWSHRASGRENRIRRYVSEYRNNVPLRVLCRSCNGAGNQSVHGTRAQREAAAECPF